MNKEANGRAIKGVYTIVVVKGTVYPEFRNNNNITKKQKPLTFKPLGADRSAHTTVVMLPPELSPSANVLRTCRGVVSRSVHVTIDSSVLSSFAASLSKSSSAIQWDESSWHFTSSTSSENTALYVLTLDALNFCFWPSSKSQLQYEHLATALTKLAEESESTPDSFIFCPEKLASLTPQSLASLVDPLLPVPLPDVAERTRLLNELGIGLITFFGGSALSLIAKADRSADKLAFLIAQTFSGFRDSCVDPSTGRQVFFYKRAQIAVADLWAAFNHSSPCDFTDISSITTFADYRIPQLLRQLKVISYSKTLSHKIDEGVELEAGSVEELEIRAATVVVVDRLVAEVKDLGRDEMTAVSMDWCLWQKLGRRWRRRVE